MIAVKHRSLQINLMVSILVGILEKWKALPPKEVKASPFGGSQRNTQRNAISNTTYYLNSE